MLPAGFSPVQQRNNLSYSSHASTFFGGGGLLGKAMQYDVESTIILHQVFVLRHLT